MIYSFRNNNHIMNMSWYTKHCNAMPLGGYTVFIWSYFFNLERVFLIIIRLWFIGAAIIFVNCTVSGHDYDIFFFFYIQSRDNWVTLFYSLLFHWYLLKRCVMYEKQTRQTERLMLSDKQSTIWKRKRSMVTYCSYFLFSVTASVKQSTHNM